MYNSTFVLEVYCSHLNTLYYIQTQVDPHASNNSTKSKHTRHKNILTVAVRLCYNEITKLNGLASILNDHILLSPHRLCWIDFSHNQISEISDDLLTIKSLSILYFHCNNIKSKKQILKLQNLPQLTKLTMFGNPAEQKDGYRTWMIASFPNVRSLDFIRVTPDDKLVANTDINLAKNKIKR